VFVVLFVALEEEWKVEDDGGRPTTRPTQDDKCAMSIDAARQVAANRVRILVRMDRGMDDD
jgi:hypothetical protein